MPSPGVDYAPDPRVEPVLRSHLDDGTVGSVKTAAQLAELQQQELRDNPPVPAGTLPPPVVDYDPTAGPGEEPPRQAVIDYDPDVDEEIVALESRLATLRGKLEAQLADAKARKEAQQERPYPPRTIETGVPVFIADPDKKEAADGGQVWEHPAGVSGIAPEQVSPDAEHGEGSQPSRAGSEQEQVLPQGPDRGQQREQGHQLAQPTNQLRHAEQEKQPEVPRATGTRGHSDTGKAKQKPRDE